MSKETNYTYKLATLDDINEFVKTDFIGSYRYGQTIVWKIWICKNGGWDGVWEYLRMKWNM